MTFPDENLALFVDRIAGLRSRATQGPRNTYTVVLGQLLQCELIDEDTRQQAIDRPPVSETNRSAR